MAENTLRNVELLRAGRWKASQGDGTITEEDMNAVVESFRTINQIGGFRPVLKLGHAEMQRFFGGEEGQPNLGFVTNVRRAGETVVADFVDMAPALFDMVKAGRYHQLSIEMLRQAKYAGQSFKNVLTAVALLGVEFPAVKSLKDLRDALLSEEVPEGLEGFETAVTLTALSREAEVPEPKTYTEEEHKAILEAEVAKAVETAKTALSADVDTLKTQVTALTQRAEAAEGALHKFTMEQRDKDVVAIVDAAVKAGKWLPKDRDVLLAQGRAQMSLAKFGEGEDDGLAAFRKFAEGLPQVVALNAETGAAAETDVNTNTGGKKAAEIIADRQVALFTEKKAKDMGEAFRLALDEADDALRQRYMKGE